MDDVLETWLRAVTDLDFEATTGAAHRRSGPIELEELAGRAPRRPQAPPAWTGYDDAVVDRFPSDWFETDDTDEAWRDHLHAIDGTAASLAAPPPRLGLVPGDGGGTTPQPDAAAVAEHLGTVRKVLLNEFDHGGAGWATNLLHAPGREGLITLISTTLRETLGYFAAINLTHAPEQTKVAISGGILGLAGILNVVSAIRQEVQRKGNWTTRAARATTLGLLGGAAAVAQRTTGLAPLAPLLIKSAGYCLSRDGINLLVRLEDGQDNPLDLKAIAVEMIVYGLNQWMVNELQGLSLSGTSEAALALPYREIFGALAAYSAANALGETVQALEFPAVNTFFNRLGGGIHDALQAAGQTRLATKFHLPMGEQLAARFPAANGIVGGIKGSEVADKVLGTMTARLTAFATLYCMLDLLSRAGPAAKMSADASAHLLNALAGFSLGLLTFPFLGVVATSPPPVRPVPAGEV